MLYHGVPGHLRRPIGDWFLDWLGRHEDDLPLVLCLKLQLTPNYGQDYAGHLYGIVGGSNADGALDVIDAALRLAPFPDEGLVHELEFLLEQGGSAYAVLLPGGDSQPRLVDRVSSAVVDARDEAMDSASQAGRLNAARRLRSAWLSAYGRSPNPSAAVAEAIRAVEAAAIPVVCPDQAEASLGHVIGQLRQPARYRSVIVDQAGDDDVTPVVGMLSMLWRAHRDRHEGVEPAEVVSQEAAQACVHLATTLVQWFVAGVVRRRE